MWKLMVIGLDGATWRIIKPLVDKGKLPTFKKLMDNGTWGTLESTIPPVTGAAWLSLATGKNPGKTGVIDFLNRRDTSYRLYPVNSLDFKDVSFWDYLNRTNIKIGIFNYPMLFPPYKINGFMVSGLGASPHDGITYPQTLKQEIIKLVDEYQTYIDYHNKKYEDLDKFILDLNDFLNKFEKTVYYIVSQKNWDFLFVVFSVTDWVQHIMWKYIDRGHIQYDEKNSMKYKEEFNSFWERTDKIIDNIIKIIGENTIVFLVSDHGFGPNDQTFNLLKWLEHKKYLVRKNSHIVKNGVLNILNTFIPKLIKKLVPSEFKVKVTNTLSTNVFEFIDFEKSKAYCLGHTIPFGAIYINADCEKERTLIKNKLINDLLNLSKEIKVDVEIYESKNIYYGNKISLLPDIIFTINNWRCVIIEDSFNRPIFEKKPFSSRHTGSHRLNGIFLAYGPGIKKGHEIENAKIYDIAPTILHIFGLPIPNDMDGRVLTEIFEPDSEFAKREAKYVGPSYYDQLSEKQKIRAKLNKIKTTKKL